MSDEREVDRLRQLAEIGRAFTYTTSLEQVAALTVQRGAGLLGASAAVLMLTDADDRMHVRATHGIPEERVAHVAAEATETTEVTERLQALLAVSDERFLAVPLVAGGAVTGLVAVGLPQPATEQDEWLLSALADHAGVAIENARLSGEVRIDFEDRLRSSEGATSAMDRALATLAHDIRTPLGAIDGYCWNMEDGVYGAVSEQQLKVLGRVRMSGRHLLSLLENVMDMARLNAGAVTVLADPVRLAVVAREAVHMVMPAAAAKLQTLALEGDEVTVTGDQARIRQVLVNLLGNAVKFTPDGGTITVRTGTMERDDARWGTVHVDDTGPGIAKAECAAIFEPYYRSEGTAKAPGVGLGLAISHALVVQMGGTLSVESEPGVGSSFQIRLPLHA